jgi:predicted enzyme involved in methoxymalonyl-ACP biosynthesis
VTATAGTLERPGLAARLVGPADVPRVVRLVAGAGRFNVTGARLDEGTAVAMSADPEHLVAAFTRGDELAGAAWVRRRGRVWWVLNLVLAAGAEAQGVEFAIVDWIVRHAREAGCAALTGRYVPSEHNAPAAGFWEAAGFIPCGEDGLYTLVPGDPPAHPTTRAARTGRPLPKE